MSEHPEHGKRARIRDQFLDLGLARQGLQSYEEGEVDCEWPSHPVGPRRLLRDRGADEEEKRRMLEELGAP